MASPFLVTKLKKTLRFKITPTILHYSQLHQLMYAIDDLGDGIVAKTYSGIALKNCKSFNTLIYSSYIRQQYLHKLEFIYYSHKTYM